MTKRKHQVPLALRIVRWVFPKVEALYPPLAHRYFVKIFFTPLRYKASPKEKEWVDSADKFEVTVNHKRIQCYKWGEGPVVLVVHGWAGRAAQFRKFIPVLIKYGYQIVGFDGPAHGKSEGKQTNILEFEEVFRQIFLKVGNPVAVVAHSFGGVASLFAAKNGLPIPKLINIASPSIGDEIIKTYLRAINGSLSTGEAFKSFMVKRYGKPFDEFSALYLATHLPNPLKLLLVHDENDEEVTIQHPEELKKVYPSTELIRTKGLGHNRILKDEMVIRKCLEFIRK